MPDPPRRSEGSESIWRAPVRRILEVGEPETILFGSYVRRTVDREGSYAAASLYAQQAAPPSRTARLARWSREARR